MITLTLTEAQLVHLHEVFDAAESCIPLVFDSNIAEWLQNIQDLRADIDRQEEA